MTYYIVHNSKTEIIWKFIIVFWALLWYITHKYIMSQNFLSHRRLQRGKNSLDI